MDSNPRRAWCLDFAIRERSPHFLRAFDRELTLIIALADLPTVYKTHKISLASFDLDYRAFVFHYFHPFRFTYWVQLSFLFTFLLSRLSTCAFSSSSTSLLRLFHLDLVSPLDAPRPR